MNEPTIVPEKELDISGTLGLGEVKEIFDLIPGLGNPKSVSAPQITPSSGDEKEEETAIEQVKPDEIETPEIDDDIPAEVIETAPTPSVYKNIVQTMIDNGTWFPVEGLEEMEVDESTFQQIVKEQGKANEDSLLEGKVSVDTLPDVLKQAIEIAQSGGNPLEVLQANAQMQNPFDNLDLEDEQTQIDLLAWRYKKNGLTDKEIMPILTNLQQEGKLKESAEKVKEEVDTQYQNYIEKLKKDAADRKEEEATALKEYKKTFKESLSKFELNDSFSKKLVDAVTKKDDDGSFGLDAIYDTVRRDPEKAVDLALFLLNKDEYIAQLSKATINKDKADTFRTIKLSPKSKSGSSTNIENDENKDERKVISFSALGQ